MKKYKILPYILSMSLILSACGANNTAQDSEQTSTETTVSEQSTEDTKKVDEGKEEEKDAEKETAEVDPDASEGKAKGYKGDVIAHVSFDGDKIKAYRGPRHHSLKITSLATKNSFWRTNKVIPKLFYL